MYTLIKNFGFVLLAFIGGVSVALAEPATGWMGFRNQTGTTLIIRETYANGRVGVSQKIFDNETYRDTPASVGQRKFSIYDTKDPDKPLLSGFFPTSTSRENVMYILKSDGRGGLQIEAVKLPITSPTPNKKR